MKKRELLERIERLERRIEELEGFRMYPPVYVPYTQVCTCGNQVGTSLCPVHGFWSRTTYTPQITYTTTTNSPDTLWVDS